MCANRFPKRKGKPVYASERHTAWFDMRGCQSYRSFSSRPRLMELNGAEMLYRLFFVAHCWPSYFPPFVLDRPNREMPTGTGHSHTSKMWLRVMGRYWLEHAGRYNEYCINLCTYRNKNKGVIYFYYPNTGPAFLYFKVTIIKNAF